MIWWSKQQLKSKDLKSRQRVIEKLVAEGGAKACDALMEVLKDADPLIRCDMAAALGQLADQRATGPLTVALRDANESVRVAAAKSLGRIGNPRAETSLVAALQDPAAEVRWAAARALEELAWQPADATQRAIHFVAQGKFELAVASGADAIEPIAFVLRNGAYQERHTAVLALGQIADARVQKPLIAALSDKEDQVRCAAVEALRKLGDNSAATPLIAALADTAKNVRAAAAEALGEFKAQQALEPLRRALADKNWEVRSAAALALGRFRDPQALDPIIGLLNDREHEVRENAARALEMLGDREAITALVLALKDEKQNVRQRANAALIALDRNWSRTEAARGAAPQLQDALKHTEYWVRQSAADALAKISHAQTAELRGTPPSQPALAAPLHFRRQAAIETFIAMLSDFDREMRAAAADALGRIAQPSTIPALSHAAKDPDEAVRNCAAHALAVLQAGQNLPEARPPGAAEIFPF
ncbi:MAG: HEAT repeat domain-containing protein [Pedosphaera sp.]|nr:HEAT repeat domain-containing protein [Pedosphaera sp.]